MFPAGALALCLFLDGPPIGSLAREGHEEAGGSTLDLKQSVTVGERVDHIGRLARVLSIGAHDHITTLEIRAVSG